MKNILIIGTGTIGEPLIGLLADFKNKLGIRVYFHKRTPLVDEIAKVNSLINRGANLVVDPEKVEAFQELGHEPVLIYQAALDLCDVIIDCTPAGNLAKKEHYLPLLKKNKKKFFIAQGSEKGFGMPYAYGINDAALIESDSQFVQVVSCNTHNIVSLVKTICPTTTDLHYGDFVCIRRANDISQNGSFIASPEVGNHKYSSFGTHHAKDARDLLATLYEHPNLFSSALKVNTQYMHTIRFSLHIRKYATEKDIRDRFKNNKFIALTHKSLANKVFSFGRDHGYYGRIFNHTVVSLPSLHIGRNNGNTVISGFCFTPQDGNSLLSSIAAALYAIHGKQYKKYMNIFDDYLFTRV
jgi:glyceraldehyde-3-phosphate dehydrogenase/erythrose-4-phosphate dehydrogenase